MKTRRQPKSGAPLRARKLAVVLSALGLVCLPIRAQESTVRTDQVQEDGTHIRGKMIDRSRTTEQPVEPNTEYQSSAFDGLSPSALTDGERRVMLETVAPDSVAQNQVTLEDEAKGSRFASGRAVLLPPTIEVLNRLMRTLDGKRDIRGGLTACRE